MAEIILVAGATLVYDKIKQFHNITTLGKLNIYPNQEELTMFVQSKDFNKQKKCWNLKIKLTMEEKFAASAVAMVMRKPRRSTINLARHVTKSTKTNAGKREVPIGNNLWIKSKKPTPNK